MKSPENKATTAVTSDEKLYDARENLTSPAKNKVRPIITRRRENATSDEDEKSGDFSDESDEDVDGHNEIDFNDEHSQEVQNVLDMKSEQFIKNHENNKNGKNNQNELNGHNDQEESESESTSNRPQHERIEEEFRKGKFFMHDDRGLVSDDDVNTSSSSSSSSNPPTNQNISEIELPDSSKASSIVSQNTGNSQVNHKNKSLSSGDAILAKILAGSRMDRVVKKKNVSVVTVTNTGKISRYGKNGFPPPNSSNYKTVVKPVVKVNDLVRVDQLKVEDEQIEQTDKHGQHVENSDVHEDWAEEAQIQVEQHKNQSQKDTNVDHDDRREPEFTKTENLRQPETYRNDNFGNDNKFQRKQKTSRWGHDKFNNDKQAPKIKRELVKEYGFDIRDKYDTVGGTNEKKENEKLSKTTRERRNGDGNDSKSR